MKYPVFLLFIFISLTCNGQTQTNYDESKIPEFELPDPLVMLNGDKVMNADTWIKKRRPEILRLFEEQVYGKMPGRLDISSFEIVEESTHNIKVNVFRIEIVLTPSTSMVITSRSTAKFK